MRFGVCGYLTGKNGDGVEFNLPAAVKDSGFDYIELPLSTIAGLDEVEFEGVLSALDDAGLPCEACNLFFPGSLRLTGTRKRIRQELRQYLKLAIGRAARLGARVIVFGSGGARRVPPGFAKELAWVQLVGDAAHGG